MDYSIKRVEFKPHDFIEVSGITFPQYNNNKICSTGKNEFNCRWFWNKNFPLPIMKELEDIVITTNIYLQEKNVIPKRWPTGLLPNQEEYPFEFEMVKYVIVNSDYKLEDADCSYVTILTKSVYFPSTSAEVDIHFPISEQLFMELAKLL